LDGDGGRFGCGGGGVGCCILGDMLLGDIRTYWGRFSRSLDPSRGRRFLICSGGKIVLFLTASPYGQGFSRPLQTKEGLRETHEATSRRQKVGGLGAFQKKTTFSRRDRLEDEGGRDNSTWLDGNERNAGGKGTRKMALREEANYSYSGGVAPRKKQAALEEKSFVRYVGT